MNSGELREFMIKNNISAEIADQLHAQCIDESTAPYVTKDMLIHDLKLLLGPALQVLRLFNQFANKLEPTEPTEDTAVIVIPDNSEKKGAAQWSTLDPVESIELADETVDNSVGIAGVTTLNKTSSNYDSSTDLIALLADKDSVAQELLTALQCGDEISNQQIRLLVRIVVENLLLQCGNYPKTTCKMALALNIVNTWPQLGQKTFPHLPAHFLFFNSNASLIEGRSKNGGLIENRVDNIMRKLPYEQRRYVKRRKIDTTTSAIAPILEPVQLENANRNTVEQSLRMTMENRNKLRKGGAPAGQILKYFPGLLRYDGDMIDIEFKLLELHDRDDINDSPLVGLMPKIIQSSNLDLGAGDVELKAVLSLLATLPKPKNKKTLMPITNIVEWLAEEFMKWLHVEDDIDAYINNNKWTQPHILCVTERPSLHGDGFFRIVVDQHGMAAGTNFLRAVELLYKMYYIFNLKYPPKLKALFLFLDLYVFKLKTAKPTVQMDNYYKKLNKIV